MPHRYQAANPLLTSAEILLGSQEAAEELNGSLHGSLKYSGISRAQLVSGEGYLPLHQVVNFLNHAAQALGCDDFGLVVAKHQPPARFAMVGQLIRFCADLGGAIDDAINFSILNSQYTAWELQESEQSVTLVRRVRTSLELSLSQFQPLALAVTYKAMSAVCQRRIALSQVMFSHRAPQSTERARALFSAPLLYDQPAAGLVIPRRELATPILTADPAVYQLLRGQLTALAASAGGEQSVVERLRHELRRTVGSRHCNLNGVAQSWGVHSRDLQRRLAASGVSFRQLLLEERQALAEEYLRDSSISVLELSDLLGYSNASAFSRSFKQLTGLAPNHWRDRIATPLS